MARIALLLLLCLTLLFFATAEINVNKTIDLEAFKNNTVLFSTTTINDPSEALLHGFIDCTVSPSGSCQQGDTLSFLGAMQTNNNTLLKFKQIDIMFYEPTTFTPLLNITQDFKYFSITLPNDSNVIRDVAIPWKYTIKSGVVFQGRIIYANTPTTLFSDDSQFIYEFTGSAQTVKPLILPFSTRFAKRGAQHVDATVVWPQLDFSSGGLLYVNIFNLQSEYEGLHLKLLGPLTFAFPNAAMVCQVDSYPSKANVILSDDRKTLSVDFPDDILYDAGRNIAFSCNLPIILPSTSQLSIYNITTQYTKLQVGYIKEGEPMFSDWNYPFGHIDIHPLRTVVDPVPIISRSSSEGIIVGDLLMCKYTYGLLNNNYLFPYPMKEKWSLVVSSDNNEFEIIGPAVTKVWDVGPHIVNVDIIQRYPRWAAHRINNTSWQFPAIDVHFDDFLNNPETMGAGLYNTAVSLNIPIKIQPNADGQAKVQCQFTHSRPVTAVVNNNNEQIKKTNLTQIVLHNYTSVHPVSQAMFRGAEKIKMAYLPWGSKEFQLLIWNLQQLTTQITLEIPQYNGDAQWVGSPTTCEVQPAKPKKIDGQLVPIPEETAFTIRSSGSGALFRSFSTSTYNLEAGANYIIKCPGLKYEGLLKQGEYHETVVFVKFMDHSSSSTERNNVYANGVIIPPYVAGHPKKHLNFIKVMLVAFVGLIFVVMVGWLLWRCLRRCCHKDTKPQQGGKFKPSSKSQKSNELNQRLL